MPTKSRTISPSSHNSVLMKIKLEAISNYIRNFYPTKKDRDWPEKVKKAKQNPLKK